MDIELHQFFVILVHPMERLAIFRLQYVSIFIKVIRNVLLSEVDVLCSQVYHDEIGLNFDDFGKDVLLLRWLVS
jgi:hypothetical protein